MTGTITVHPPTSNFALLADESLFVKEHYKKEYYTAPNGKKVLKLKDVPLFRSGTFNDSMGDPHTYEQFHIEGFVRNFDYLKNSKVLENVPARKGHRSGGIFSSKDPIEGLVGWVRSLRTEDRVAPHDGQTYTYLLGDVDILDPEAQEKIELGLWINRSAEVGTHISNNGTETAPAFLGFAFVDMSAVEGLNFTSKNNASVLLTTEDIPMSGESVATPPVITSVAKFMCGGSEFTTPEKVQGYIIDLEAKFAAAQADATAKEAELASLRDFQKTVVEGARVDFVNGLVEDNKLLATQKDVTLELVKSYTADQFDKFKLMFANAAPNPLLGNHGVQNGDATDPDKLNNKSNEAYDANIGILKDFKALKYDDDRIKASAAYAAVIKHDPNFQLASISN